MSAVILSGGRIVGSAGAVYLQGTSGNGFYPSGHWVAAKMSLAAVHPRPDTETTTIAQHRIAFYDGTNSIPFQTPVGVQGGARPLVWSVVAGPPGMTVGAAYGATNYGIVTWTPTSAISSGSPTTVTIRATDQQFNTVDIIWTIYTSSSTADFIFVNSSTGNDSTGNGTFALPYQTFAKIMGGNTTTTTFPGARVYMNGSFQWPLYSDITSPSGGYCGINSANIPVVYMALPGATANIDASIAQLIDTGSGANDFYLSGSTTSRTVITGSSATATDTHTFEWYTVNRFTLWNCDFVNPINRANGSNTNSTTVFTSNSGGMKNYYHIMGCTETGRSGAASNSMLMTSMFSVQNVVFEFNTAAGQSGFGVYFKDSNRFVTAAYNRIDLQPNSSSDGDAFLFGSQQNNQTSGNLEACYNFITGGAIKFDFQATAGAFNQYSYRNTIYRTDTNEAYAIGQNGGVGPYTSDNDVLIARGTTLIAAGITGTGTEVQVSWNGGSPPPSNNPINTTTGALVDATTAWRTLYLGFRGCEVA